MAAIPIPTPTIWETPQLLSSTLWKLQARNTTWKLLGHMPDCTWLYIEHPSCSLVFVQVDAWIFWLWFQAWKTCRQQHWQPTALLLRLAQDICGTSDPYVEVYVNDVKQVRCGFGGFLRSFMGFCFSIRLPINSARIMGKSKFTTTLESACWVW